MINRTNYELYFLDYLDGNLNPNQKAELFEFLERHPDLNAELDEVKDMVLEKVNKPHPEKEFLYKSKIHQKNIDEYFIAYHERDLTPADYQEVDDFLEQHPEEYVQFKLFKKLKLIPDESIQYKSKKALKKSDNRIIKHPAFYIGLSIASSLLLFVFYFTGMNSNSRNYETKAESFAPENKISLNGEQTTPRSPFLDALARQQENENKHKKTARKNFAMNNHAVTENVKKINEQPTTEREYSLDKMEPKQCKDFYQANANTPYLTETINMSSNIHFSNDPKQQIVSINLPRLKNREDLQHFGWKIAYATLGFVNAVINANIEINKKVNEEGSMTAFKIESKHFSINRSTN